MLHSELYEKLKKGNGRCSFDESEKEEIKISVDKLVCRGYVQSCSIDYVNRSISVSVFN